MHKSEKQPNFQETLFGDAQTADTAYADVYDILPVGMDTSQTESVQENPCPNAPTVADVLNIYKDISKLAVIERYLNVLYRPFTCFLNNNCRYNLRTLKRILPASRYDPDRHMALEATHFAPMGIVKIYGNGNIYTQAYSRKSAFQVLAKFSRVMDELGGYTSSLRHPKYNLVNATFCMPFHLDLQAFNKRNKPYTLYNPKCRPFVTYRMPDTKIKIAIFPVGFVYVMFCISPTETQRAIAHVLPILYPCWAPPNESDLEVNHGDINYKLLWEREFQKEEDFSMQWGATPA